jgi:phage terminase large subunit-like protein
METGMGARDQPLQVIITTAGDNLAGPCYADIQDHRKVLEGVRENDELFYIEYTIDKGDDWKSEAALRKANPNFGVSVSGDFLRARQRDAIATPRKAGAFKTKHLDLWVSARAAYFDVEAWRRCADPGSRSAPRGLASSWLQGRRCKLGLDLASKIDIAALEYLFEPLGGEATKDDPYIRIGRYFVPADRSRSRRPIRAGTRSTCSTSRRATSSTMTRSSGDRRGDVSSSRSSRSPTIRTRRPIWSPGCRPRACRSSNTGRWCSTSASR